MFEMKQIMEMAGKLKEQLATAQHQSANARCTGEAGGGMVCITLSGRYEAVAVHIDPQALQDVALLEDLVRVAVNQAVAKVGAEQQQSMGGLAQGLGVDLSAILPK